MSNQTAARGLSLARMNQIKVNLALCIACAGLDADLRDATVGELKDFADSYDLLQQENDRLRERLQGLDVEP